MFVLQVSDSEENRLSAVEMFSQIVDISPYLVRDFIMKEGQTQEEVGAFSPVSSFYKPTSENFVVHQVYY